ncbi:MAG: tryptophan--tRNA ligase [Candidatus Methanosuratincola sp.]|jgi:tryptophanyl-tRNA synthetase|nr:tryptophan--tRNA ligase [Candidatus Methanosuratincola sp.]
MENSDSIVTPWEVRGEVDYKELIEKFGVDPLTPDIVERLRRHAGGLHVLLRRGMFFSHRELNEWIDSYEKGVKAVLYTGRGPSGNTHLGHLIPWLFTKYLQDAFKCDLYFQITDDEKFLFNPELSTDQVAEYAKENILDIIAVGFDPERTKIFTNLTYSKPLYNMAVRVAKHVTFSTAKATFGFSESSNIGMIFFPAMQAAPCFIHQYLTSEDAHVLIPCAIDQEPYWRISRDVAPKLGYRKPAGVYSKFIPGLGSGGKMSASIPDTAIFLSDTREEAVRKVKNAFTGGQPTIREQKEKGGNPDVCVVYSYLYSLFDEDDKAVAETYASCKAGGLICGECKERLARKVAEFLEDHRARRERAKGSVEKFLLREWRT